MTAYSAFNSEVRLFVPMCPTPVIELAVKETAISFAVQSEAIKDKLTINLVTGTNTYTLVAPTGLVPIRIQHATLVERPLEATSEDLLLQLGDYRQRSGRPDRYYQERTDQVSVFPTPNSDEPMLATVVFKPSRTSTDLRDDLAEAHWETIMNGAISRLSMMHGSDWYNPDLATVRGIAFQQGVNEAKKLALNADKNKLRSVRYGGL